MDRLRSASTTSVMNVMNGACHNVALTCAYGVFANSLDNYTTTNGSVDTSALIAAISEMFYQSLICPDNSTYKGGPHIDSNGNLEAGFVNTACECNSGYEVVGDACLLKCANTAAGGGGRNVYGICVCADGYTGDGYKCTRTE